MLGADVGADDAWSALVERADGNAFYLEELIRAVAEGKGDALPGDGAGDGRRRASRRLDPEARRRPARRQRLRPGLLARRRCSRCSAAHGRAALERAARASSCEREVLVRRGEGRFPGEHEYVFRHALVREAAYAMLTEDDRALGHRLARRVARARRRARRRWCSPSTSSAAASPARAVALVPRAPPSRRSRATISRRRIARAERGVACGATGEVLGALRLLQAEAQLWRGDNAEGVRLGLEAMRCVAAGQRRWCRAAGQAAAAAGASPTTERLALLARRADRTVGAEGARSAAFTVACSRARCLLLMLDRSDRAEALLEQLYHLAHDPRARTSPSRTPGSSAPRRCKGYFAEDVGAYLRKSEAVAASFERAGDTRLATLQRVSVGYAYLLLGPTPRPSARCAR